MYAKTHTPREKWRDHPPLRVPRPGDQATRTPVETDVRIIGAFFGAGHPKAPKKKKSRR